MEIETVLQTIIALFTVIVGLGYIFNMLLRPLKEDLARRREDIKSIKNFLFKGAKEDTNSSERGE